MSEDGLHFVARGEARGEPALFLHGFMGSSADWSDVVERMKGEHYCICVDLPGHGRSVGLGGDYTMERTGRLLSDVLDRAGAPHAHVVGYSMGGRTALYFAVVHPERCRSLLLESASPGLSSEAERAARRGADEARALRLETGDFREFLAEWYRQPLFETYQHHEGLLERMIGSRRSNRPGELARSLRGMGTGSQPSLWDRLDELALPVLACAGALDGKYAEAAERMAVMMPRARAVVVPGAGHNVHAERPEEFTALLTDFISSMTL